MEITTGHKVIIIVLQFTEGSGDIGILYWYSVILPFSPSSKMGFWQLVLK
jgi:hypothetical protein